jgi:hypothetical protein
MLFLAITALSVLVCIALEGPYRRIRPLPPRPTTPKPSNE